MTEQRVQRRLAAILAADVVGYSALMQRAEEATYAEFERLKREVIEPSLSRHDGRLIKTTGDGALVEFASPFAAVRCAVEMQDHLASGGGPLRLRIGLNLGDVIVGQDGELYGDGINIAVMCRVSDAGRLRDGAAYSAAGVRKPPRKETALGGRMTGRSLELGHP